MVWLGVAIVLVTFWLIYKNYEARIVLVVSGVVMALLGDFLAHSPVTISAALDHFISQLVNGGLVPTITTVMGFGYVMSFTKCSDHLVSALVKPLTKVPVIVIPGAVLITWFLNIVLPSAAGIAAAVGVLLVPALLALKVRPAMAAAAVLAGTWGSVVSPGLMFNPQIAELAYNAKEITTNDAMVVIMKEFIPCVVAALVIAILVALVSMVLKEGVGSVKGEVIANQEKKEELKINWLMAIIPIVPLLLLVLASEQVGLLPQKAFSVPVCMLIGTGLGILVGLFNKQNLGDTSKKFCRGAGDGYCDVVILIAAAELFACGMESIGLSDALINAMKGSHDVALFAAAVGPFGMAVISGSGNAAALAFNEAITPHAAEFGLTVVQLGAIAQVAGALGRTMSPVAGCCIVLAGFAGVNPMDMIKRTAIPCIIAVAVSTVLLTMMA